MDCVGGGRQLKLAEQQLAAETITDHTSAIMNMPSHYAEGQY